MSWTAYPWTVAVRQTGNLGVLTGSLRQNFALPQHLIFPTFRVVLVGAVTAGDLSVSLRFGFRDADANVATEGIDFALLSTANASDTRSPVWAIAAAPPNFVGNPNSILPPRVAVRITTNAVTGFNGQYFVAYCGIIAP